MQGNICPSMVESQQRFIRKGCRTCDRLATPLRRIVIPSLALKFSLSVLMEDWLDLLIWIKFCLSSGDSQDEEEEAKPLTVSAEIITVYCPCLGHWQVIHFQHNKEPMFNRDKVNVCSFFLGGGNYLRGWNDMKDK